MSIRHQMRARVEKLLKDMINSPDFPKEEENTIYVIFLPREETFGEERIEVSEQELDLEDKESVKRFLDRTTREALEADVKGLRLYGYIFESEGELKLITDEREDHAELIFQRIERMREEV